MKTLFTFLSFFFLVTVTYGQSNSDSVAIIRLLEKESATWRSGDVKEHAACWSVRPYSRILVSTSDGVVIDVPPQTVVTPAGVMGKGGSSANSNYKMSITGTGAWVSHNEVSTDASGDKSYSYEFKMLEKIDGDWKLVGESIHLYKPK